MPIHPSVWLSRRGSIAEKTSGPRYKNWHELDATMLRMTPEDAAKIISILKNTKAREELATGNQNRNKNRMQRRPSQSFDSKQKIERNQIPTNSQTYFRKYLQRKSQFRSRSTIILTPLLYSCVKMEKTVRNETWLPLEDCWLLIVDYLFIYLYVHSILLFIPKRWLIIPIRTIRKSTRESCVVYKMKHDWSIYHCFRNSTEHTLHLKLACFRENQNKKSCSGSTRESVGSWLINRQHHHCAYEYGRLRSL